LKLAEQEALLKEWQIRLGLCDWHIKMYPKCKPEDLELEDVAGEVSWQEVNKTARINIIKPKYYGNRIEPFDFEKTLVHELLHLKTCLLSDQVDELQARVAHMLIDDLARALVDAKRFGTEDEEKTCK